MPLIVRPLATVNRFADHDPIQSGRDLSVDAVVEGSVQTADNRIRVSVRLLRVRDAKPLWAQTFEVAADNTFTLEDSIAERVVSNLSGSLTGQQQRALSKRPLQTPLPTPTIYAVDASRPITTPKTGTAKPFTTCKMPS